MNKTASSAVYVVVVVVFIFASSAQASPLLSASALLAYTAGMHRILPVVVPAGAEAHSEMHRGSGEVFDNSKCFSPASIGISLRADVFRAAFTDHLFAMSGQDAKYRFAYLKRDLVYVRSKS